MFNMIFTIIIIYIIYKKLSDTSYVGLNSFLVKSGFNNINTIKENSSGSFVVANFHGENFLFFTAKCSLSTNTANEIIDFANANHYHNIIVVLGNTTITPSISSLLSKNNITIWKNLTLKNLVNITPDTVARSVLKTSNIDDNCEIYESYDPIQDGKKANTILGNIFNNKIEKL